MKTVRDALELQPGALDIKLSDQIEQLDQLIHGEGNGSAFFAKTHITQGMRDLVEEGLSRLAGASSQANFHLKQAMGGGKTHLLVGFGLLAKHKDLRATYLPDHPHTKSFGAARVAAFNGRNYPTCYFWGEIANQLGNGKLFEKFWSRGPEAPDENAWLELFDGNEPTLILLDELPPYFHKYLQNPIGQGTVADVATTAFANLLSAAGKKKNVCVVVSDLEAAYDSGSSLINKALDISKRELGRGVRTITPVDLATDEIYSILKKRLFAKLPLEQDIQEIADNYGKRLSEAAKSKTVTRGAESLADEIYDTYPFHPRLKNIIALFKENENFKQTRGLIELVSRLLRSVWNRKDNDVYLIGPQHFDLADALVRDKITEISGMRDVIARDIWDSQKSAHSQQIDISIQKDSASQVGTLLLTASLSTAVNSVKGLTREEIVECLITPHRNASEFLNAFEELEKTAWYLHYTQEERFYFDRQENLTKLLQSLANDAPENQVEDLIRNRLLEMFKPSRKTVYEEVLPLPKLEDATEKVRRGRLLLIVSPDAKVPPEEVLKFFGGITQKNNICVLSGDKTAIATVEKSARQYFAVQKADHRIPQGHPQRDELERKKESYNKDFGATVLNLFDKVFFPRQRSGREPELIHKVLDQTWNQSLPYNGEEQIQKTLTSDPIKLFLDVDQNFDAILDKAQDLLWPEGLDEVRWTDAEDRYCEQAGMYWLPPRGLDTLKAKAVAQGKWEDLGNGYISKKPKKKKTSVQVTLEGEPSEDGTIRLRINPLNAGSRPIIYVHENGVVTKESPKINELSLRTTAVKVQFLVVDPTEQFETGDPVEFKNTLRLRTNLQNRDGKRFIELFVAPGADIRFTLDGTEARNGTKYTGPVEIGDAAITVYAFAEAHGVETKQQFPFQAKGKSGVVIVDTKPAALVAKQGPKTLDDAAKTFNAFKYAKENQVSFEGVTITIGQGNKSGSIMFTDVAVSGLQLEELVTKMQILFEPASPITMRFKRAKFSTGHDLKVFAEKLGLSLADGEVEQ
jgi:hypothetical protein